VGAALAQLFRRRLRQRWSPFQGRYPASEVNDGPCPEKPDHLRPPHGLPHVAAGGLDRESQAGSKALAGGRPAAAYSQVAKTGTACRRIGEASPGPVSPPGRAS
jgi:hypothetical protein